MSRRRRLVGGIALATALLCAGVAWAATGSLTFVDVEKNLVAGVAGMNQPLDVAVSPDNKNVYVSAAASNAVTTFTRDPGNGALTYLESDVDGAGGVDGIAGTFGVAVSPDGKNVYVAGRNESSLGIFNRDLGTGALTYVSKLTDGIGGVDGLSGPWGLTVSPDGKNVYVAAQGENAIGTFTRNISNGLLTYLELDQDGVGGVDGLNGITNVEVSPLPGANLYGASCGADSAVPVFTRDPGTGALTFLEVKKDGVGGVEGLNCSRDVTVSADGANVYSVAESDDSVASFTRSASNGALTFLEQDVDGAGGVDGLNGARDVAIAPDCGSVYVASAVDDAVAGFNRDATTGALSFVEQDKDNTAGVDGIDQAVGVAVSPNNASVYATGEFDDAIGAFSREASATPCASSNPGGPTARTVTLSASKKKVKKRKKVTLSGDIASADAAACEASQAVALQRKGAKDRDFKTVATLTTDGSGAFSSKQKLKKTAQFRATLGAGSACDAAESASKKVKVKKKKKRH